MPFIAEPIIGHDQNRWQVIETSPSGVDIPRCETVSREWAWRIAALLNDDEPTEVTEGCEECQRLREEGL